MTSTPPADPQLTALTAQLNEQKINEAQVGAINAFIYPPMEGRASAPRPN
jgi:hypothetical protein